MSRKILIAALLTSLVCATGASAAQAPTVGAVKVFKAGQKTPVDIGGNHLHHGATIRKGTQLLRWKITMHGASNARVTLSCPTGTKHVGLGTLDHPKITFKVANGSSYGHRTIKVQYYGGQAGVNLDGASGHTYALCKG
jgi:hypothetical protein